MIKQTPLITLILMVFCIWFYSCSGLQKPPVTKNYFDLDIHAPVSAAGILLAQGSTLLVKEFIISPEFDSHAFVYRISENEYTTDFYNEFVTYPARLISDKIKETLYASPYFSPSVTQIPKDVSYRLSGKITRLYGNLQDEKKPEAVIEIRFSLERKIQREDALAFEKIHTQTYTERKALISTEPAQIAAGWKKGLKTILESFLKDIEQQIQIKS